MTPRPASLPFSKMHGIGNDFVLLDCRHAPFTLDTAQIRAMGNRHAGIGFDQLLSIEPARNPACAFYYGIWNTDGSPSGQCGNGVRCVAAWLHRAGALETDVPVRLESPSGPVGVRLLADGQVMVDMGEPDFAPLASGLAVSESDDAPSADPMPFALILGTHGGPQAGIVLQAGVVSMGNPHAVVEVDALDDPALESFGPALTAHPRFARQTNAGFVQCIDRGHLRLRVHERGAGWTLACGTGACAAMAVLHQRGRVDDRVQVDLPGGRLRIDWPGPGHALWMTGPAAFVFEGAWPLVAATAD
jgi:diaminopimelate epimerase